MRRASGNVPSAATAVSSSASLSVRPSSLGQLLLVEQVDELGHDLGGRRGHGRADVGEAAVGEDGVDGARGDRGADLGLGAVGAERLQLLAILPLARG